MAAVRDAGHEMFVHYTTFTLLGGLMTIVSNSGLHGYTHEVCLKIFETDTTLNDAVEPSVNDT